MKMTTTMTECNGYCSVHIVNLLSILINYFLIKEFYDFFFMSTTKRDAIYKQLLLGVAFPNLGNWDSENMNRDKGLAAGTIRTVLSFSCGKDTRKIPSFSHGKTRDYHGIPAHFDGWAG